MDILDDMGSPGPLEALRIAIAQARMAEGYEAAQERAKARGVTPEIRDAAWERLGNKVTIQLTLPQELLSDASGELVAAGALGISVGDAIEKVLRMVMAETSKLVGAEIERIKAEGASGAEGVQDAA